MTATEEAETEAPVGEQPAATEEPKVEENPVKGKKPRTPREKKPRQPKPKPATHPPYFQVFLCLFMFQVFISYKHALTKNRLLILLIIWYF
ncbi:hypothetical protein OIU78_029026 [Salix suchowensis]|nr:hypothetical protein OIU78_029026 [Salix suchowensis]